MCSYDVLQSVFEVLLIALVFTEKVNIDSVLISDYSLLLRPLGIEMTTYIQR